MTHPPADRSDGSLIVTTPATAPPPTADPPARIPRCRMHDRRNNPCPNPALDPDEAAVQICVAHAARVMQLVSDGFGAASRTPR